MAPFHCITPKFLEAIYHLNMTIKVFVYLRQQNIFVIFSEIPMLDR